MTRDNMKQEKVQWPSYVICFVYDLEEVMNIYYHVKQNQRAFVRIEKRKEYVTVSWTHEEDVLSLNVQRYPKHICVASVMDKFTHEAFWACNQFADPVSTYDSREFHFCG